jgi:hypothetical protein
MLATMRVAVTLIDPHWELREDVVVDADDATAMHAVMLSAPQSPRCHGGGERTCQDGDTAGDLPRGLVSHHRFAVGGTCDRIDVHQVRALEEPQEPQGSHPEPDHHDRSPPPTHSVSPPF